MTAPRVGMAETLALANSAGWEVQPVRVLLPAQDAPAVSSGEFARYYAEIEADQWTREQDPADARIWFPCD